MDDFPVGPVLVLVAAAVIVVWAVAMTAVGMSTDAACIRHDYPSSSVTWSLDRYCIKRVDQTDSVVSLSKLK